MWKSYEYFLKKLLTFPHASYILKLPTLLNEVVQYKANTCNFKIRLIMIKIEVVIKDSENNSCNVTVKKPKKLSSTTDTELRTASVVKNTIDKAMEDLSKTNK